MFPGLLSANGLDTAPVVDRAQIPESIQKNCPQTSDLKKILKTLTVYMKNFQH